MHKYIFEDIKAKTVSKLLNHREQLFHLHKVDKREIPKGCIVFNWRTQNISFYILCKIIRDRDCFSFEIYWSKKHISPSHLLAIMSPYEDIENKPRLSEAIDGDWGCPIGSAICLLFWL
jgi:hypothetical protein